MPSVLVTGGAGFIGSHLARALLAEGWSVHVVDDLTTGRAVNVPAGAELHEVDLAAGGALDGLPRVDAIAHLAGQSSGEKSFDDPGHDLDANARTTVALAAWALDIGVPVMAHASSMGVYGQPDDLPVAEDAPCRPLSWYGASKLAAEGALGVAARQGLRTVSLRMFSIYGPGQDLTDMRQGMASIFLAFALRGETVTVKGSLERVRDLVHVEDCVDAWLRALTQPVSGALNVGTGTGTTVRELVALAIAAAGRPADHSVISEGTTPGDQFAMIADTTRVRETLGWTPRRELREGLEAMAAGARQAAA